MTSREDRPPVTPSRSTRKRWFLGSLALLLLVLAVTWLTIEPRVPHRVQILTGPEKTVYHEYGTRYAEYLRRQGLRTEIVSTAGSLENLERLRHADVPTVAFAQTGVESELSDDDGTEHLVSLASVAYEPFWVFTRKDRPIASFREVEDRIVGVGPTGSGSRATTELLLNDNSLVSDIQQVYGAGETPSAVAETLVQGQVDVISVVGETHAPIVDHLLRHPDVVPVSLSRTAAYARRHRSLAELLLPRGAFDLAQDIPSQDLMLISPTTNLVARDDLQPAIVGVFLQAAKEIHHPASLFAAEGHFPNSSNTSLPMSVAAVRYQSQGQGLVYRIFPFWLAGLLSWLAKLLTPFFTAALFLFSALPNLIQFRFSIRLKRLYRRLERIEVPPDKDHDRADLERKLDDLDEESAAMRVPRSQIAPYFEFRQNLHDVKDRLLR